MFKQWHASPDAVKYPRIPILQDIEFIQLTRLPSSSTPIPKNLKLVAYRSFSESVFTIALQSEVSRRQVLRYVAHRRVSKASVLRSIRYPFPRI